MQAINKDTEHLLWSATSAAILVTEKENGMFLKYCGLGKINYKNRHGIVKSVNFHDTNVYIHNL